MPKAKHHNPKRIDALLRRAGAECAGKVHWFAEIDSTNSWLMAHREHAAVCIAEWQSAGRGRRGKAWRAPPSGAVLLSIGWELGGVPAAGLSLLGGLAGVEGLWRAGVPGVGVKWPNDLVTHSRKLGGVLTELRGGYAVIGMGVNVATPPRELAATLQTDLQLLGYNIDRDLLAAEIIIALCGYLREFCARGGFAPFVEEWNALNIHNRDIVIVQLPNETFTGIVTGVDESGALFIDSGDSGGTRRIFSSEARIRADFRAI